MASLLLPNQTLRPVVWAQHFRWVSRLQTEHQHHNLEDENGDYCTAQWETGEQEEWSCLLDPSAIDRAVFPSFDKILLMRGMMARCLRRDGSWEPRWTFGHPNEKGIHLSECTMGGGVGPSDCLKMNCQLPVEFIIHPHQDISCRCWCRGRKTEENAFRHPTQQFLRDWNIPPTCDWLTQPQSMNVKIHLWLSSHSNILRLCTLSHWLFWTEPVSLFLLTDWFM